MVASTLSRDDWEEAAGKTSIDGSLGNFRESSRDTVEIGLILPWKEGSSRPVSHLEHPPNPVVRDFKTSGNGELLTGAHHGDKGFLGAGPDDGGYRNLWDFRRRFSWLLWLSNLLVYNETELWEVIPFPS